MTRHLLAQQQQQPHHATTKPKQQHQQQQQISQPLQQQLRPHYCTLTSRLLHTTPRVAKGKNPGTLEQQLETRQRLLRNKQRRAEELQQEKQRVELKQQKQQWKKQNTTKNGTTDGESQSKTDDKKEQGEAVINEAEVQVIGSDGVNLGKMSLSAAHDIAKKDALTLREVAKRPEITIYRLMTQQQIEAAVAKKSPGKAPPPKDEEYMKLKMKKVQLRVGMGENDLQVKMKQLEKFIHAPYQVTVEVTKMRRRNTGSADERDVPLEDFFKEAVGKVDCELGQRITKNRQHVFACVVYKIG